MKRASNPLASIRRMGDGIARQEYRREREREIERVRDKERER